jgi:hypothetical protein
VNEYIAKKWSNESFPKPVAIKLDLFARLASKNIAARVL